MYVLQFAWARMQIETDHAVLQVAASKSLQVPSVRDAAPFAEKTRAIALDIGQPSSQTRAHQWPMPALSPE
jgi:hypothetical protein